MTPHPIIEVARALTDLVLPQHCAGCGRVPGRLCAGCATRLTAGPFRVTPRRARDRLPAVWAAATYEGPVRAALVAYKERGRRSLAGPLGAALGRAVVAAAPLAPAACVELVRVPAEPSRARARGYDPLALLADAATRPGSPAGGARDGPGPALRHVRGVADQAGLDARSRAANLAGALEAVGSRAAGLRGRTVVVVDDVVTTGATLAEAVRALRAGGVHVHAAAVLAATPGGR